MAEVVESARPLHTSSLWDYQRAFYQSQGPSSWRNAVVPFRTTTSAMLATAYVRTVAAYLDDCEREWQRFDRTVPVDIVELGSGSGATALYFLLAWHGPMGPAHPQPIRFIATDIVAANLDAISNYPGMAPFLASGQFATAHFDAETPGPLQLHTGATLLGGEASGAPLVVVANYLWDTVRARAFSIEKGALSEWQIAFTRSTPEVPHANPLVQRFKDCAPVMTRVPCKPPVFDNPRIAAVFAEQRQAEDSSFLLPETTLACVEWLAARGRPLMLLTTDKGTTMRDAREADEIPFVAAHGSFSFDVNFFALSAMVGLLGGEAWISPKRHFPLRYLVAVFGRTLAASPTLRWTLHEVFARYSVGDAHALLKAETPGSVEKDPTQAYIAILSRWRASHFDTYVYVHSLPDFTALGRHLKPSPSLQHDLCDALREILRHAHPAAAELDLGQFIGSHMAQIGAYNDALEAYGHSLQVFGRRAWRSLMGVCICLTMLDQAEALQSSYRTLKSLPLRDDEHAEFLALESRLLAAAAERKIPL